MEDARKVGKELKEGKTPGVDNIKVRFYAKKFITW